MKKHMHQNSRLWDYQILKQLGKGQYGQVFKVKSKKDEGEYALKKVNLSNAHEKEKIQAFRQIKALKLIRHPDIIDYYDSFLSVDNVYIIMEFAEKGDFSKIIQERRVKQKFYTEQQLWEIFGTLTAGVKHLHQKNIIHRDIKLQNIFMTKDNKVKLGDLGMAKIMRKQGDMLSTRVGTPVYFAPEVVQHQLYSFPVDLWALGCVFYYLTTFQHPFKDATIQTLGYYIVDRHPKPIKGQYSPHLINFISSLMEKNPNNRPNVYDVALKIKNKNQTKINNKVSIHNIRQLLSIRQMLKKDIEFDLASPLSPKKGLSPSKQLNYYQELKNRYAETTVLRQGANTPSQSSSPNKSPRRSPRKGQTFRNMSMVLQNKSKPKVDPIPLSPMIKSNGFTEFHKSKVNTYRSRKSSLWTSLEKNKSQLVLQMPEIDKISSKTARLRGPVI